MRESLKEMAFDYTEEQLEERLRFVDAGWPTWRFNDVVAYLHLWYDGGTRIIVDAYVPYKRISRQLRDKTFDYCYKMGEHWIRKWDNASLRDGVREAIDEAASNVSQKDLYIDLDEALLESLDLRKLMNREEKPT